MVIEGTYCVTAIASSWTSIVTSGDSGSFDGILSIPIKMRPLEVVMLVMNNHSPVAMMTEELHIVLGRAPASMTRPQEFRERIRWARINDKKDPEVVSQVSMLR